MRLSEIVRWMLFAVLVASCSDARPPAVTHVPEPSTEPVEPVVEPVVPVEPALEFPAVVRLALSDERAIDEAVERAITAEDLPGCVVLAGRRDGVVFRRAYGSARVVPSVLPMTADAIFDLASVSKMFTTAAVLQLHEAGLLDLDRAIDSVMPEMAGWGITPRHLLTHTAGLRTVNPLGDYDDDRNASLQRTLRGAVERPPGQYNYSDLGFIALGVLVERVSSKRLEVYLAENVFERVGAKDAAFNPGASRRVVPTEFAARRGDPPPMIHGDVNDPRAWRLGGVAGHAGIFASADDVGRFAEGLLGQHGLLRSETLALLNSPADLRRANGALARRGLGVGMDMRTREGWSNTSFGHGGYTGTWLWVDPARDFYVVILSHRVHPEGGGRAGPLRSQLGRLFNAALPRVRALPESPTRLGIDVLRAQGFERLDGKRVAVLTNDSGRAGDGARTWELLHRHTNLVRVFTPEHGLSADREGAIANSSVAGLEVVSLFGRQRTPGPDSLAGVDVVVVDLQDVGARFYTYGATLGRIMQAAQDAGVAVLVLDRPNPLGGAVEGPVLREAHRSFVNHQPGWPIRHGLTMGEMARLLKTQRELTVDLDVVGMQGWSHDQDWSETGLRWVPPSPNLRTTEQVELYPGVALVEGTNVSVGRGTDRPFQLVGAPWMDAEAVLEAIPERARRGLALEATRFRPTSARHRRAWCRGFSIGIADPNTANPIRFGLALLAALARVHPDDWDSERAVRIVGDDRVMAALQGPLEALESIGEDERTAFTEARRDALLY